MAHAERCPICYGKGKVEKEESKRNYMGQIPEFVNCHGCGGRGWVEVSDPFIPWPEIKK